MAGELSNVQNQNKKQHKTAFTRTCETKSQDWGLIADKVLTKVNRYTLVYDEALCHNTSLLIAGVAVCELR